MSDKILYSDLFADDILAKIQELKNGIKDLQGEYGKLKGELQSKAIELKINLSKQGLNLNELGELANQVDKLSKAIKILDDAQIQAAKASKVAEQAERERIKTETELEKLEQQRLRTEQAKNKQQRDNNKLTDEEKARVEALSQQIEILLADKENLAKADRETIKYIEVEKQSYNELTQVYNVLKNALNKVTGEERKQNVVLAEMEKQAKSVYEQMNNLQKATGKHTLNVGNYQSAFDGLGWSVRNVVRELPALGINLNTFFLAISNNIPIVIDEIKRFNEEQKKVAEAGTQVQSVGKKIISTVLSWQTLLIVGITVLTKYGKQIGEWVVGLFKAKRAVDKLISSQEALNRMRVDVAEATKDEEVELGLIVDRIKEIEKGTDEWKNAIARVNEITDANLNTTTATIGQVEEVTKAYIEQAIQLAKNQAIIDQISESERNKIKRGLVLNRGGRSADGILSVMGLSYYDKEGNISKEGERANKYIEALNNVARAEQRVKEAEDERYDTEHGGKVYYEDAMMILKQYKNTITDFENWVRSEFQILDDNAIQNLLAEYKITPTNEDRKTNGKGREATKKDYEDLWRELAEIRVEALKESYEKELAQEELNNRLALHDYEEGLEEKKKVLKENKDNNFISEEEYNKEVVNLEKQYDEIIEKQKEAHYNRLLELRAEHEKDIAEERKKALDKEIEAIVAKYEVEEQYMRKRSRNQTEEGAKNVQLIKQIEAQKKIIEELEASKDKDRAIPLSIEELQQLDERIGNAENIITTLKSKLTIDRRQSKENPLTEWVGDMLTSGLKDMDETELRKVYIKKLMEVYGIDEETAKKIADLIGIEKIWADIEQQGINQAKAIGSFVKDTLNSLGDIADAYLDLADAKLSAAEAGIDAAQEAYDKEKSLLEAGYANSVETAWAELEEQKKIAKEAEEQKKKAQEVQLAMDTAQQTSSLVTAVANTFKEFPTPYNAIMAGVMISSFLASKALAFKATQYGEGHVELLDYGGSHASGQDMPLATDRRGRQRRVEKGEAFAVFNKKAVRRHGYSKIKSIVDGINKGQYEDRALADVERNMTLGMMYEQSRVDLTRVETMLGKVAENTSKRTYIDKEGNMVEIDGNVRRTYR
jgi:hypothetical protein